MSDSDFRDHNCLIIDGDPTFLKMFEAMLRSLGISKIASACNGSEALSILASSPRVIDVTLCDLWMPSGNGLQLLKVIRTGQVKSVRLDACFIMISAVASPDAIKAAAALDVNGYLIKPISQEKLRDAIIRGRQKHFRVDPLRYAQVVVPESAL